MADARTVTRLLRVWKDGERSVEEELVPLIYDELRRIASDCLRRERPGHTLHPTDLVSEAYLRMCQAALPDLTDRLHFFAVAARTMRQILVDHARQRLAEKRGGGERPLELDEETIAQFRPADLVALDEALKQLAELDERKARVIELHYFGGLSRDEIGQLFGVHPNTVSRDLRLGQGWMHKQLRGSPKET